MHRAQGRILQPIHRQEPLLRAAHRPAQLQPRAGQPRPQRHPGAARVCTARKREPKHAKLHQTRKAGRDAEGSVDSYQNDPHNYTKPGT